MTKRNGDSTSSSLLDFPRPSHTVSRLAAQIPKHMQDSWTVYSRKAGFVGFSVYAGIGSDYDLVYNV